MKLAPELIPVIQITLPIVAAIFGASWIQNKRLDDLVTRVNAMDARILDLLGRMMSNHSELLVLIEKNHSETIQKFADLDRRLTRIEGERRIVR